MESKEKRQESSGSKDEDTEVSRYPTKPQENVYGEVEKLYELKERGIITEEEFKAKKKQLLGLNN